MSPKPDKKPAKPKQKPKPAKMPAGPIVAAKGQQPPKLQSREQTAKTLANSDPGGKNLPGDSGGVDPTKPIGKGNPPRAHSFKPGKSGNPKGYPKGQPNAATIIKYWLSRKEEVDNPISGKRERLTQFDILALRAIADGRNGKGTIDVLTKLTDRTDGKPVQSTKLLNAAGHELEILVGFQAPAAAPEPKPKKEVKKK
jgi:hypothetical protein